MPIEGDNLFMKDVEFYNQPKENIDKKLNELLEIKKKQREQELKTGMQVVVSSSKVGVDLADGKMQSQWEYPNDRQEIVTCLNCKDKKVVKQLTTQVKKNLGKKDINEMQVNQNNNKLSNIDTESPYVFNNNIDIKSNSDDGYKSKNTRSNNVKKELKKRNEEIDSP